MEQELLTIIREFGFPVFWCIFLYKIWDTLSVLLLFGLIGYGVKKAWPALRDFLKTL